jgi:hypothetical protein
LLARMPGDIITVAMKFQIVLTSQTRDEFLVGIGLGAPQLVIEVYNRQDNSQLATTLEQKAKQRDRIDPARNGHANAVAGMQHIVLPNAGDQALRQ